jgi:hypothetical protein
LKESKNKADHASNQTSGTIAVHYFVEDAHDVELCVVLDRDTAGTNGLNCRERCSAVVCWTDISSKERCDRRWCD